MIRNICITAVLLSLTLIGVHWLVQAPTLMAFAERLPGPDSAAKLEYYVGQVYYVAKDYDTADTYFKNVFTHFPSSPYAERAHLYWLECLSERLYRAPAQAVAECKAFLKLYPESTYAPRVRKLQEICESGTLH